MELESLLETGNLALEERRFSDAAEIFIEAWVRVGKAWELTPLVGHALRLAGATIRRRAFWCRVFSEAPPEGVHDLYELATQLLEAGAPDEAVALFQRIVALRSEDPVTYSALASALRSAGQLDQAWHAIEVAMQRAPEDGTFLLTAAQIRHSQGDLDEAIQLLEKAEAARPGHGGTRLQRGLTHLLAGCFVRGWEDFEYRNRPANDTSIKEWQGEPLYGTVVVRREQGAGDLIQFLRFVPLLKERGAKRVIIECERSFTRLLEATGHDVTLAGTIPPADWTVPMLSLPFRLGIDEPPDLVEPSLSRIRSPARSDPRRPLRLGVAWMGNQDFGATFLRDFNPALIEMLLEVPDVEWTSLQFGEPLPGSPQRGAVTLAGDWLDTARTVAALDGVISVDTSIAHLAGAMGIPVAILLPYSPDWRWGPAGSRTQWYPSASLIRQTAPRNWGGVIPMVHRWIADRLDSARAITSP